MIAILEVDKEKLAESGNSFKQEMRLMEQSGIKLIECQEQKVEYEYASFLWSRSRGRYEQVNRAVHREQLCRNRLQEYISNGWLNIDYDTNRAVFKKRKVTMFVSEWEELK